MTQKDHQLHSDFVAYGRNAKEWLRKCALLLPEIDKQKIWQQKGFVSIVEYAAKLAGMSKNSVKNALWVGRHIEDKPALQKVAEIKGIYAVRPVAKIATVETQEFWAEKALEMSKPTLETYAREVVKEGLFETSSGCPGTQMKPATKSITMQLSTDTAEELEKLKGQGEWDILMKELLEMRKQKLEKEKPESVKTESRHIPVKAERYAVKRTNGACSFPGCSKPYSILHHTQRFALERVHDPDRLQPLCKAHERIAHHGLIQNEEQPAQSWRIKKHADKNDAKFYIDSLVAMYRTRSYAQS